MTPEKLTVEDIKHINYEKNIIIKYERLDLDFN